MDIHSRSSAFRMVGTVAAVTGIAGPVGQAVARRLAGECRSLVLSDPDPEAAQSVLDEVERIRALHGLDVDPVFVEADAATDSGARALVRATVSTFGRVDAVVVNEAIMVQNGAEGDGALSISLDPFVPAIRAAGSALERQPEGNVVLTALLGGAWPGALGIAPHRAAVTTMGAFVHAAACALHSRGVTLNGIALEDPARADRAFDFTTTRPATTVRVDRQRRSHLYYDAAHAARFLASSEARGVAGQTFILNGCGPAAIPPYGTPEEAKAFAGYFDHIERFRG